MIWSVFSNPELVGGAWWLIGGMLVVSAVTLVFMATLGQIIGRRSRFLAILAGSAFVPAIMVVLAYGAGYATRQDFHGGAMAAMMVLMIAIWAAPISIFTSIGFVFWRTLRARA